GPGEHLREVARGGRAVGADVGALIGPGVSAQCPDRAIRVAGDLELTFGIAGMVGGGEVLAAILDPFDWPAGEARRERDPEIFRGEIAAGRGAPRRRRFPPCGSRFRATPSASPISAG